MWLRSLTDEMADREETRQLVKEYEKHKDNKLYESVMDIIVRANQEEFEEVKGMCKALEELMADVIEAREKEASERGLEQGMQQGMQQGIYKAIEILKDLGLADTEIKQKISQKYDISQEKVEALMQGI